MLLVYHKYFEDFQSMMCPHRQLAIPSLHGGRGSELSFLFSRGQRAGGLPLQKREGRWDRAHTRVWALGPLDRAPHTGRRASEPWLCDLHTHHR